MPSTATAGRTSFLPFCCNQAAARNAMNAGIPLFQAFSPVPVQRSTYCDCIKVGVKIDPACGSGNFLTETYLSLRRQENEVIRELSDMDKKQLSGQIAFAGTSYPIKVSIQQFYGIEINDFAVTVAKTALWIAESQMLEDTKDIEYLNVN